LKYPCLNLFYKTHIKIQKNPVIENDITVEVIRDPKKLLKEFLDMNFEDLAQNLNKVFTTPVEERMSHLVHEKLPNGKVFSGRFSFDTFDGTKITISQKVSKQIWNYKYYSINVVKEDLNYTVNLDYENGRFINSTKEGKILINNRNSVSYLPRSLMLERNADIVNLPQYIKEISTPHKNPAKQIIKFSTQTKNNASLIKQNEEEVEKVLQQLDKEDDI